MWNDDQLSQARYTAFQDADTKQDLNVGTIEVVSGPNPGIYLMTPVPPYGSLSNDNNSIAGLRTMASVPMAQLTRQFVPRGMPVPDRAPQDQYIIHDYGKPVP